MVARPIISRSPARTKSLPVKVCPYSIVYATDNVEHLPKLSRITSNHSIPLLPPQLFCLLAPVDQVPSSRTRVSLLPAHLYPNQGPEKLLSSLDGIKIYRSLYRKRMPESGSTRTGSNNRDHRKWKTGSHLHTRPTEKLIPPSCASVRFLYSEICMFCLDDFVTAGLCDPFVIHIYTSILTLSLLFLALPSNPRSLSVLSVMSFPPHVFYIDGTTNPARGIMVQKFERISATLEVRASGVGHVSVLSVLICHARSFR